MTMFGHRAERLFIAIVFIWFGLLKVFGEKSATTIIANSIYWFDPAMAVPVLGFWEFAIGLSLASPKILRLAVLLLLIRFPGTLLALFYNYEECFAGSLFLPTIQGQYLLKELTLVGAALIIGSTVNDEVQNRGLDGR